MKKIKKMNESKSYLFWKFAKDDHMWNKSSGLFLHCIGCQGLAISFTGEQMNESHVSFFKSVVESYSGTVEGISSHTVQVAVQKVPQQGNPTRIRPIWPACFDTAIYGTIFSVVV